MEEVACERSARELVIPGTPAAPTPRRGGGSPTRTTQRRTEQHPMDMLLYIAGPPLVTFLAGVIVGHSIREDDTVANPFEVAGGDER